MKWITKENFIDLLFSIGFLMTSIGFFIWSVMIGLIVTGIGLMAISYLIHQGGD